MTQHLFNKGQSASWYDRAWGEGANRHTDVIIRFPLQRENAVWKQGVECHKKSTTKLCQRGVARVGQLTASNDSNIWHLSEHKWALWMDSYKPIPFDLWLNTPCSTSWPPSISIQYNTWHVLHTPQRYNLWLTLSCTGQIDIYCTKQRLCFAWHTHGRLPYVQLWWSYCCHLLLIFP